MARMAKMTAATGHVAAMAGVGAVARMTRERVKMLLSKDLE